MADRWHIRLFGTLRAERGAWSFARPHTRKTSALLACLALAEGRPQPRAHLVERFWPEQPGGHGRNNLSKSLSALRQHLEPPGVERGSVVIADVEAIGLDPDAFTTDVAAVGRALEEAESAAGARRLAALERALALGAEPLLDGLDDDWSAAERERWRARLLLAAHQVIGQHLAAGDAAAALPHALAAEARDPLSEQAARDLMRVYAALGEPARALRVRDRLEVEVEREVDAPLSAETHALAREIAAAATRERASARAGAGGGAGAPAAGPAGAGAGAGAAATDRGAAPARAAGSVVEARRPAAGAPPLVLASLIGRAAELDALEAAVAAGRRVVVLTGPGGVGKTRLALALVERLRARGAEFGAGAAANAGTAADAAAHAGAAGCAFIDLEALERADALLAAIADRVAAGGPAGGAADGPADGPAGAADGAQPALERAVAALGERPPLLVLDNLEQLLPAARAPLAALLGRAPGLRCVVTSRIAIGLEGETVLRIGPLPQPPREADAAKAAASASVVLLCEAARAAGSALPADEATARDLGALARALDGLPLALRLAASRLQVLSPRQLLERIRERGALAATGAPSGAGPARHASLRDAVGWSLALLAPPLVRLLGQLAVFRGGFDLAAAEAVTEDPLTLDGLCDLAAASLVEVEPRGGAAAEGAGGAARYRLLVPVREVAAEALEPAERAATADRHLALALAIAGTADAEVRGPEPQRALARVREEEGNLEAALAWALASDTPGAPEARGARAERGVALALALHRSWALRGWAAEGRGWLERAIERAPPASDTLARALVAAADLALLAGDVEAAERFIAQSVPVRRSLGDPRGAARSTYNLGVLALRRDDFARARALLTDAVTGLCATDDRIVLPNALSNLAHVLAITGDGDGAERAAEEAVALALERGDDALVAELRVTAASALLERGDPARAEAHLRAALATGERLGAARTRFLALEGLVAVSLGRGDRAAAQSAADRMTEAAERAGALASEITDLASAAVAAHGGAWAACRERARRALPGLVRAGERRLAAVALGRLAAAALGLGDAGAAARLLGAAEALRERVGAPVPAGARREVADTRERAARALGASAYERERALGRSSDPLAAAASLV